MRQDGGWARAERLVERLGERLDSFWTDGVRDAVLDPAAVAEADELRALVLRVPDGPPGEQTLYVLDHSVLSAIAHLHYARCLLLGPDTEAAGPEVPLMLMLFALVAQFTPDEVPEDLRPHLGGVPAPPAQDLEALSERALELFGRWQSASDADALEEAISRWRTIEGLLPDAHPGRPMMLSNLGAALRFRYGLRGTEADLEDGITLGRRAVRLAPPDDPSRGMYLANLCGSLLVRCGRHRDPADLDAAVDTGTEAVRTGGEPRAHIHANTGNALLMRYERASAPADLDAAAEAFEHAVRHAAPDDPQRPMYRANLARALEHRFRRHGRRADLDAAADAAQRAVAECPPAHPGRHGYLSILSGVRRYQADLTGAPADLDAAVDTARQALAAVPATSPDREATAEALGQALRLRFKWLHRQQDIDEAVALLSPDGDTGGAPETHYNRGRVLLARFRDTSDPADLDAAIDAARRAVDACPDSPEQGVPLTLLGETLHTRAQLTGSPEDAQEAVTVLRGARALLAGFHPTALAKCLSELGLALGRRFDLTGSPPDVDEAIAAFKEALRLDTHDTEPAIDESNLGGDLMRRYVLTGDPDDLAEAVTWHRRAAARLTGEDDPHAAQVLFNLGRSLQAVYQRSGDLGALDEAVRHLEAALRARRAPGSRHRSGPDHALALSNLGAALRVRAESVGSRADLDRAVDLSRQAVTALPAGHRDRATYLTNLCTTLLVRHTWFADREDLADAVRAGRAAVDATPATDTGPLAVHLTNLGLALRHRYEASGALADLDEAIEAHRAAVDALPAGHVDSSLHRSNLALALLSRYQRTDDTADLDASVEAARVAADSLPDGHPQRPALLSNLALTLRGRYDSTGRRADADEAVDRLRDAVRLCPAGHPQRPVNLSNLVVALLRRCGDGNPLSATAADAGDAAEAARAAREALRAVPEDDVRRMQCLSNLGTALVIRSRTDDDPDDLLQAYDAYREATRITTAPATARFRAARAWARTAADAGDWQEALDAHRAAVAELPLLAWHGLDHQDRLDALGRTLGLAGEAAAVALHTGRPQEALRLLEQGRGVLLAQSLDSRDDMTELRERAPQLADRIQEIRTALDTPDPDPDPAAAADPARLTRARRTAAERRQELAREMDELVERARALPGLEDFLRPPSLTRLQAAATHGPVIVVNTSTLRCDAFVVTRADLHVVPLPGLSLADEGGLLERVDSLLTALSALGRSPADTWRAQRILTRTLAWLWDTVAGPVLAALYENPPTGNRLWWCPTGLLSLLPLHAAGHYGPKDGTGRSLPDRYVCSYTTTLRALATQTTRRRHEGPPAPIRLLAVDQSDTPGLPPLPHARKEARKLAKRLPGSTLLTGDQATRAALLHALPTHAFLHFSGHGTQDPTDSAGGALYLHDHQQSGPLTMTDISRLRLAHARLAFLSACETARGAAVLPDEAVHLAGALQLAGFTHVVAAQWAVDDACALQIADTFYAGLTGDPATPLDPDRAAHALNNAVHHLRHQNSDPLWWAAYVHTGP